MKGVSYSSGQQRQQALARKRREQFEASVSVCNRLNDLCLLARMIRSGLLGSPLRVSPLRVYGFAVYENLFCDTPER